MQINALTLYSIFQVSLVLQMHPSCEAWQS
jgi:hypothetical protein